MNELIKQVSPKQASRVASRLLKTGQTSMFADGDDGAMEAGKSPNLQVVGNLVYDMANMLCWVRNPVEIVPGGTGLETVIAKGVWSDGFARGTIMLMMNPSDGDTIQIGDVVFEFDNNSTTTAGNIAVTIGGSAAITSETFTTIINANIAAITATFADGLISLVADQMGVAYNYLISSSAPTVTKAGMSGGLDTISYAKNDLVQKGMVWYICTESHTEAEDPEALEYWVGTPWTASAANLTTPSIHTWANAISNCLMTYAGVGPWSVFNPCGWRLPNINEFLSLVDISKTAPPSRIAGLKASKYWTSSSKQDGSSRHYVSLQYAQIYVTTSAVSEVSYALPVRSLIP